MPQRSPILHVGRVTGVLCYLLSLPTCTLANNEQPGHLSIEFEPVRTWTNVFGKTCEGDLVHYFGAAVSLQTDFDSVVVPLASLSDEDISYVQSVLKKIGREDWFPGKAMATDATELRMDSANWKSQLSQWSRLLENADSHTANSAWNQIRNVRDPAALPVLAEMITHTKNPCVAVACVEALASIDTEVATTRLVELAIEDTRFPVTMSAAWEIRMREKSPETFKAYAKYLRSGRYRDRALVSIVTTKIAEGKRTGYRVEPEFTRTLIAILTVKQPQRVPFVQWTTNDTGWRTSAGGGASRSKQMRSKWGMALRFFDVHHPTALSVLQQYTGQDFGYDRRNWSRWLRDSAENHSDFKAP